MKKSKTIMLTFFVFMLVLFFSFTVKATTNEKVILKTSDEEFMIYYQDICKSEFEFAFSTKKDEKEENLNFTKSAKDGTKEGSLNVAYVDKNSLDQFFTEKKSFIWIRNNEDKIIVSGDLIDLNDSLDNTKIDLVNTTTKRINLDLNQTNTTNELVNGVNTSITTGKAVIIPNENSKYSYQLIKVTDQNSDAKELFELAKKLENNEKDNFVNLSMCKRFYDLYSKLMPNNFEEVNNLEILQPEDSRQGDEYILFIKETNGNKEIIDAKFLTSVYKEESLVSRICINLSKLKKNIVKKRRVK